VMGATGSSSVSTPLLAVELELECWCVWEKVDKATSDALEVACDAFEDGACDALEMSPSSKAASSSGSETLSRPRSSSSSGPGHVGGSSGMVRGS
jgi:hypothetical protein